MGLRQVIAAGVCVVALAGAATAQEFSISFDWSGLKLCTTGSPKTVSNPQFKITGLPAGTTYIQFQLKDLDVPGYFHGGGGVNMSADGTVPANSFNYRSPCPPKRIHLYEWTAIAKTGKNGQSLGKAKARRPYP